MSARPVEAKAARVRALDWHRGLAVLVMIECHCLVLLSAAYKDHPLQLWLNGINGLVAPSFIFAAGFALSMVMCRAAQKPEGRNQRAVKSLVRIMEVLVVANILKHQMWPVWSEPSWWLRVDVLSCIAYSLLVLWAAVFLGGNRPRLIAAVMFVLAGAVFLASPWTESIEGAWGPLKHFINNKTDSPFPVLPWAAYAFIGAGLGALLSIPDRGLRFLVIGLSVMFACGQALALSPSILERLYPWNTYILSNAGERIWKVAAIALVLLGVEQYGRRQGWAMQNPLTKLLEFYGTSSLSAFFFHITILYGSFRGYGLLRAIPRNASWPTYWIVTVLVIAATGVLCWATGIVEEYLPWKKKKPAPAGTASREMSTKS